MKKIKDWIDYDTACNYDENGLGGMGGFFKYGMRWDNYVEKFTEEGRLEAEILREGIIENNIKCTGSEQQNGYDCIPLWSDNKVDTFSMRAWGDLMAAIWSTEENKDYSYMDFYC